MIGYGSIAAKMCSTNARRFAAWSALARVDTVQRFAGRDHADRPLLLAEQGLEALDRIAALELDYADVSKYETALSHEHDWNPYPALDAFHKNGAMPGNLMVEEYSLMEKLHTMPAFLDTFHVLYPKLAVGEDLGGAMKIAVLCAGLVAGAGTLAAAATALLTRRRRA